MSGRSLCLLAGLILASPLAGPARADDELDRNLQRDRVLADKARVDAGRALATAAKLERTDPEAAQAELQRALAQVQNASELPAAERNRLAAQLQGRLHVVAETLRRRRVDQEVAQKTPARKPAAGQPAAGSSAGVAQDFIGNANRQAAEQARLRQEYNRGFAGAVEAIEAAAVPSDRDMKLPRDWQQRSDIRKQTVGSKMSEKEVALVKALNSVLTVDFKNTSFKNAINTLMERTGQAILVDEASMREANISYDEPVTLSARKVTFRTALRKILADYGLAYVIREGTIHVMTSQKARDQMVVRTYPVDDLVMPDPQLARIYGPLAARAQMVANAQGLVDTIQRSVDPSLWAANGSGGGGSITFHEPTLSIIIRAPTEFHYQFQGSSLSPR